MFLTLAIFFLQLLIIFFLPDAGLVPMLAARLQESFDSAFLSFQEHLLIILLMR